jgi:hypothetical protein
MTYARGVDINVKWLVKVDKYYITIITYSQIINILTSYKFIFVQWEIPCANLHTTYEINNSTHTKIFAFDFINRHNYTKFGFKN